METIEILCNRHHSHIVTKKEFEKYWRQLGSPTLDSVEDIELVMGYIVDKLHALSN